MARTYRRERHREEYKESKLNRKRYNKTKRQKEKNFLKKDTLNFEPEEMYPMVKNTGGKNLTERKKKK